MPTLKLEPNGSKEPNKSIIPKVMPKLVKDYEQSKWLTGC
jgi:hypothetical protein